MRIDTRTGDGRGIEVRGFSAAATTDDMALLRQHVYYDKIVVLKEQSLGIEEFVTLGSALGKPVAYYEPMYHHPDSEYVFVSSNVNRDTGRVGVPKTGAFWHSDYQFMPEPFAITCFYPQRLPAAGRGTYFIDMAQAYRRLSPRLRDAIENTFCLHSARRYVKIRPEDVFRPLGEVLAEVEDRTPPQRRPTVLHHPVTKEPLLYVSEAFTYAIQDAAGTALPGTLLSDLLAESGQLDDTYSHPNIFLQPYEPGDLVLWDNRTLIHRALHNPGNDLTESYRVTVVDEYPLTLEEAA
ncbi:(3R)-3-[(carboxymethyl)amino]fatty acid oxygenase/decarboxylase [Nocardia flavorosea]|uniref:TauD/TfdA family dioxygenase n=1 Tax=Nocardia flavorosea TaxID=53429 RepID=A0A846YH35_9NOCA|nr:TauD/TfdA family dioxygenase [Nocardia flavorosea]NKY56994.1 TauD/TfdA family dioxygenase [Nocardia flavorosea]